MPHWNSHAGNVILVGERAALAAGALAAAANLADASGAQLAWVPRRAGDRGAVEAGCLPGLLPGGRPLADVAARVDVASAWELDSLARRARARRRRRCWRRLRPAS